MVKSTSVSQYSSERLVGIPNNTGNLACKEYHLPAHVAPHVDLVTPTLHFNAIIARSSDPALTKRSTHVGLGSPGQGFVGPQTTGQISTLFNELADCDKQITPICLRALYGLIYEPLAASKNSYGIGTFPEFCYLYLALMTASVEYTPQAYRPADLDMFAKKYAPGNLGKRPTLVSIDGGQNTYFSLHHSSPNFNCDDRFRPDQPVKLRLQRRI